MWCSIFFNCNLSFIFLKNSSLDITMYLWIGMMKNLLLQKYISCHKLFFLRKWVSIAYFPVKNDSFLFRVPDCNNSKIKGSPHRHLHNYNYIQPRLYYIESNGGNKRRFQVDEVGFRSPAFARGERLRPGLGQGIILQYIWVCEGFMERLLLVLLKIYANK